VTSPFDTVEKRSELVALLRRANELGLVGHGFVLEEPVNLGALNWANSAFATLEALGRFVDDK
jgi:hypothetical protein